MARLARLVLAGFTHYVIQRGHNGQRVFADAADRASYTASLREAAHAERVKVHAYALLDTEVQLLVTPASATALSRMMQALGRRYVSAYNRRHARTGTLWDGRFRCAVVAPDHTRLDVLRLIDGQSQEPGITSAGHRTGNARDAGLVDPPEYWALGNTPFEREVAYRAHLAAGLSAPRADTWRRGALGGWVVGSPEFAAQVARATQRPAAPRKAGRPPRG